MANKSKNNLLMEFISGSCQTQLPDGSKADLFELFGQSFNLFIERGDFVVGPDFAVVGARRGEFQILARQCCHKRDIAPLEEVRGGEHLGVEASGGFGLECYCAEADIFCTGEKHRGRGIDCFGGEFARFQRGGKGGAGTGFADTLDVDCRCLEIFFDDLEQGKDIEQPFAGDGAAEPEQLAHQLRTQTENDIGLGSFAFTEEVAGDNGRTVGCGFGDFRIGELCLAFRMEQQTEFPLGTAAFDHKRDQTVVDFQSVESR